MVLASVAFTSIALVWFSATEAVALEEILGAVVSTIVFPVVTAGLPDQFVPLPLKVLFDIVVTAS